MLREYVNLKFADATNEDRIHFWPFECVEPNDYMNTYLFDVVNSLSSHRQQIHLDEIQSLNPDWVRKHWPFVVQMANAGRNVYLYANQWYVYMVSGNKFVANGNTPLLGDDGIIMTGDDDKLSWTSTRVLVNMIQRAIADKDYLAEQEMIKANYESICKSLETVNLIGR